MRGVRRRACSVGTGDLACSARTRRGGDGAGGGRLSRTGISASDTAGRLPPVRPLRPRIERRAARVESPKRPREPEQVLPTTCRAKPLSVGYRVLSAERRHCPRAWLVGGHAWTARLRRSATIRFSSCRPGVDEIAFEVYEHRRGARRAASRRRRFPVGSHGEVPRSIASVDVGAAIASTFFARSSLVTDGANTWSIRSTSPGEARNRLRSLRQDDARSGDSPRGLRRCRAPMGLRRLTTSDGADSSSRIVLYARRRRRGEAMPSQHAEPTGRVNYLSPTTQVHQQTSKRYRGRRAFSLRNGQPRRVTSMKLTTVPYWRDVPAPARVVDRMHGSHCSSPRASDVGAGICRVSRARAR